MSSIEINRELSAQEAQRVAKAINFMLSKIGVDGLEALEEIYEGSATKRALINDEIKAHVKRKNKPKGGGFAGLIKSRN